MSNRRRVAYRNTVSLGSLTAGTLICATLALGLVGYVASRNRLAALAEEQRRVEQEIALFQQEIQALEKRIDTSLTRDKVHERLTSHGTHLKTVEPESILVIPMGDLTATAQLAQTHSQPEIKP